MYMAVSHLLLFTVTHTQLRHTSFAFLGCGWWLVVGGWWLVVGVGGGGGGGDELGPCIRYLRRPQISATPNDTYESKMASPIIRTKMAYKRTRFFNPSGPWVGPRGPEGPKFFRLRMLRFDWIWSSLVTFTKVDCKRCCGEVGVLPPSPERSEERESKNEGYHGYDDH